MAKDKKPNIVELLKKREIKCDMPPSEKRFELVKRSYAKWKEARPAPTEPKVHTWVAELIKVIPAIKSRPGLPSSPLEFLKQLCKLQNFQVSYDNDPNFQHIVLWLENKTKHQMSEFRPLQPKV